MATALTQPLVDIDAKRDGAVRSPARTQLAIAAALYLLTGALCLGVLAPALVRVTCALLAVLALLCAFAATIHFLIRFLHYRHAVNSLNGKLARGQDGEPALHPRTGASRAVIARWTFESGDWRTFWRREYSRVARAHVSATLMKKLMVLPVGVTCLLGLLYGYYYIANDHRGWWRTKLWKEVIACVIVYILICVVSLASSQLDMVICRWRVLRNTPEVRLSTEAVSVGGLPRWIGRVCWNSGIGRNLLGVTLEHRDATGLRGLVLVSGLLADQRPITSLRLPVPRDLPDEELFAALASLQVAHPFAIFEKRLGESIELTAQRFALQELPPDDGLVQYKLAG